MEYELHAKLKALAAKRGIKLEQLGNDLLRKALKQAEATEAVSQMFEAAFLARRKEMPNSPKLFGLMRMGSEYLRQALTRAKQLTEMRDSGQLSESAETFLAQALGIDEQIELNQKTLEGIQVPVGASYSVGHGPSGETSVVSVREGATPALTGSALKKWLKQFRGEHPNKDTGWSIRINEKTEKHIVNQHRASWKDALADLPSVIQEAVWLGKDEHKEFSSGGKIRWQHRLYAAVDVGGELYLLKLHVNETHSAKALYDIKGVEAKKPTTIKGSKTPAADFKFTKAEIADLVKQTWPGDFISSGTSYSVAPASYLSEVAAALDASQNTEAKGMIEEAALRAADRGRVWVDILEREQIYEQRAETRALQLEEDLANLELRLDEEVDALRTEKDAKIREASKLSV